MFKNEKIDENILLEMADNLYKNAFEKAESDIAEIKILEHLDKAANLLENEGLFKEAEAITGLMEVVAAKKKEKKKADKKKGKAKKKDKCEEGKCPKDSDEAVKNLKTKGWMFSADDGKKASDTSLIVTASEEDDDDEFIRNLNKLW